MRKVLSLLVCIVLLALGESAQAAVQVFEFTFDGLNTYPGFIDYPGTVTGFLTFSGVGISILPINVTISSAPAGLGLTGASFDPSDNTGSFDVSETDLTIHTDTVSMIDDGHLINLAFGKIGGSQNFLLNLTSGGVTGNDNGSSGVTFTPTSVPEPSVDGLLVSGLVLVGLGISRQRKLALN